MTRPNGREKCNGPDHKDIYETKAEAMLDLAAFKREHKRGKIYRCSWADHYHLTKGIVGQKGRRKR